MFVTNPAFSGAAIDEGVGNAPLVKVNQIGTVTETLDAMQMAREASYAAHRLSSIRRDRRHDHRGPGRCDQRGTDQTGFRRAEPIASPSTTSCCASRKSWHDRPVRRARSRSAARRAFMKPFDVLRTSPGPLVLVVLDGWGLREGARRQRHQAGPHAGLPRADRPLPAFIAPGARARWSGCRRAQMGNSEGRAHHDGRRSRRLPGPDANRQERRDGEFFEKPALRRGHGAVPGRHARAAPRRPRVDPTASTATRAISTR